ncbi:sigma 54-interacting transcriptional regulator [Tepidamorphus sp. 3E244]|uniref:sigma 54-interacting transcriptional regulator n=1 Tax=Tepidamorphus sp. 3E244 TaxID=3385498 RepID=UPI0038FCFE59
MRNDETGHADGDVTGQESEHLAATAAFADAEFGVIVVDPFDDRILAASRPATALIGVSEAELLGMSVRGLFRTAIADLFTMTLACLDGPGQWQSEFELLTPNRGPVLVECHASRSGPEDARRIVMALFDARKMRRRHARAELAAMYRGDAATIRETDRLFRDLERGNRLILNAAGEGIYGVNRFGQTTFLNPAGERMLGWKAEEIVGQVAHDIMHHSQNCGDPYPIEDCPIYAAFKDGAVHEVRDEVFWRKDGTSFPVEYTSTPIEDEGKPVGAVVVFRDISKRREQDNALKTALEEVQKLRARLEMEKAYLLDELGEHHNRHEIVGSSPAIAHVVQQIDLVAPTEATVLITGESGTGKELIARAIHNASPRRNRPLIRVNCAAIPAELFESEFFGHVRGAFTGAVSARAGRFELADGGTLFLDEVGELPLEQQGKLLRVLQEGQFERVGDNKTMNVDVRVIAATNRELRNAIMEQRFREDLYFRLAVFPIHSAPLRERPEDIPPLASVFLERAVARLNRTIAPRLSVANIEQLQTYHWPGNIRELENVIERAVIVSQDGRLHFDLPASRRPAQRDGRGEALSGEAAQPQISKRSDIHKLESDAIVSALKRSMGKVSGPGGAAEHLDMKATTLYARIKRFGIDPRDYKG